MNDAAPKPVVLPLVVGALGHADIPVLHRAPLEAEVRGVFSRLRARFADVPILVRTSLSGRAERLVARVAVEEFGAELHVILPRSERSEIREADGSAPLYADRFEDGRAELRAMLAWAQRVEVVAGPRRTGDKGRAELSERVAADIAASCSMLIAIWDGHDEGSVAHGVACRAGGLTQIVARRDGGPEPQGRLFDVRCQDDPSERVACLDRFHRAAAAMASEPDAVYRTAARRSLLRTFVGGDGMAMSDPGLTQLHDAAGVAETLAERGERRLRRAQLVMLRYASMAGVAVLAQVTLFPSFFPALILAAWAGSRAYEAWREADEERFTSQVREDGRLAEALRAQFFWRLCGVEASVIDHVPAAAAGAPDGWVQDAVEAAVRCAGPLDPASARDVPFEQRVGVAHQHWIHHRASRLAARRSTRERQRLDAEAAARPAFQAALFVGGATGALQGLWWLIDALAGFAAATTATATSVFLFGVGVAGVCALRGLMLRWRAAQAAPLDDRHEAWMEGAFRQADQVLSTMREQGDMEAAREVLAQLGEDVVPSVTAQ